MQTYDQKLFPLSPESLGAYRALFAREAERIGEHHANRTVPLAFAVNAARPLTEGAQLALNERERIELVHARERVRVERIARDERHKRITGGVYVGD